MNHARALACRITRSFPAFPSSARYTYMILISELWYRRLSQLRAMRSFVLALGKCVMAFFAPAARISQGELLLATHLNAAITSSIAG